MKNLFTALSILLVLHFWIVAPAHAKKIESELVGSWKFSTVDDRMKKSKKKKGGYTQTFSLEFLPERENRKEVSGAPFGYKIDESSLSISSSGSFSLTTVHILTGGHKERIKFRGKLSEDRKSIIDGKFDMRLGSGTFTAEKE